MRFFFYVPFNDLESLTGTARDVVAGLCNNHYMQLSIIQLLFVTIYFFFLIELNI